MQPGRRQPDSMVRVLWRKPQLSHTNNEGIQKLKDQNQNSGQRTKDNQKFFTQQLISQKSIPLHAPVRLLL
jgi:hypothetical protein